MRIAVVGAGIAGPTSLHLLAPEHPFVLDAVSAKRFQRQ
jgi:hypothetical protein